MCSCSYKNIADYRIVHYVATCDVKFQTDCTVEMYTEHHGIHKKLSKILKCSCLLLLSVQGVAADNMVIIPADDSWH